MSELDLEHTSKTDEKMEKNPKKSFKQSVLEWVETVVMALILVSVVFTFAVRIITVDGGSMKPTYYDGDRVLVSGIAGDISQGDVVIIVNTLDKPIIKRVVATEGQTVDFDDTAGELVVDGKTLPSSIFGLESGITQVPDLPGEVLAFPQQVPKGCVFVLGDNRGNSTDSRYADVGMVDCRNILGKVIFNVYPFSKAGLVKGGLL